MVSVHGMPLTERAVRSLRQAGCVRHVFICTPINLEFTDSDCTVVVGDLQTALKTAIEMFPDIRFGLIHDIERAETPPEVIKSVVDELERGAQAVIPVLPLTDTVKEVDENGRILATRDRAELRVMQSPLGAPIDVLRKAEDPRRPDVPLSTVPGHPHGLRIRTAIDVASVTP
ncbi:IspD/TarI family cytidylyltransferase [Kibdelosporangium philippinense]|uniref:IspD/TarI family cytidylyltransferase n=1 Tax=Kibdelosporangium philippinense TaxID=211113 RepID=UPI0027E012B9|nr:2-C-methyl-D-erythritol 4-phosphate cytidylyltransferase [Kibdelosporangium philippinense]